MQVGLNWSEIEEEALAGANQQWRYNIETFGPKVLPELVRGGP